METTLGEVASWSSGKHLPPDRRAGGGRHPILGANGVIGWTDSVLHTEDLITVGRVGACGETHRTSGPVWVSDNALVALPNPRVAFDYLYYFLMSFDYRSITSGTTQPLITQGKLKAQPILLPPLHEQHRIVDLLSSVDSYIESLQRKVDATRTARNAVLEDLLTAGGEDWVETKLGEVTRILRSRMDPSSLTRDHQLLHWSIPALDSSGGPAWEPASSIKSHKFLIPEPVVLYSLLNPRIPRVAIVVGGPNVVCSTEFAALAPRSGISVHFLHLSVSSAQFQRFVRELASGTTKSRERVRPSDLLEIPILLPPPHEQHRIVDILSSLDDTTSAAEGALNNAKELRRGLLSELLSGKHRIPETYDELLKSA